MDGLISKFSQIWAKIGKFWKNWLILLKIWCKIGPIGIWMGYFFLKNWIFVLVYFQILRWHVPTRTKLEYPPPDLSQLALVPFCYFAQWLQHPQFQNKTKQNWRPVPSLSAVWTAQTLLVETSASIKMMVRKYQITSESGDSCLWFYCLCTHQDWHLGLEMSEFKDLKTHNDHLNMSIDVSSLTSCHFTQGHAIVGFKAL